jgi:hypothetical protein
MKAILRRKISRPFLAKFLPASILGVFPGYYQRALLDESGMIRVQMMNAQYIRKWSQCLERLA